MGFTLNPMQMVRNHYGQDKTSWGSAGEQKLAKIGSNYHASEASGKGQVQFSDTRSDAEYSKLGRDALKTSSPKQIEEWLKLPPGTSGTGIVL